MAEIIVNNNPLPTPPNTPEVNANAPALEQEPAPIQFPEGITESSVVAYCKTRNNVFAEWAKPLFDNLKALHKLFHNEPLGRGKIALPISPSIIESVNARLQPALLNRPKFAEAVPEFIAPDNDEARAMEDFVNQAVQERSRQVEKGKQAIKSATVEAFLVWRNLWRTEMRTVSEPIYVPDPMWMPNPMDPAAEPPMVYQGDSQRQEVFGYWDWELKNPANMAWDPHTITCIQDSPWVRERAYMSYNELLRWQADGRISGVERLRWVVPAAAGSRKDDWESEIRKVDGQKSWDFTYADEKSYCIEEWWATLTTKVNGSVSQAKYRWFIAEGSTVLAFEENPLLPQRVPYGSCPLIIDPHNMTGLSMLANIKVLQEQANIFAGYQADLAERAARPTVFFDQSSGLSARTTLMKMQGMVPVQNVQGIREWDMSSVPLQQVMAYIQFLIGLARESSGANEQFQGIEGSDTATEFAGLSAAAGSRFADVVDTLAQGWLEALCRECYLHYAQFGVDGQMVVRNSTTEGATIELTVDDFAKPYSWQAASNANENAKGKELTAAMQILEVASKMPPSPEGKRFNAEKYFREVILPLHGQKNGDEWFLAPQPMMAPPGMEGGPVAPDSPVPPSMPAEALAGDISGVMA